ncbi:hypothetical protein LZ32DRAFT_599456 [Colletotrichum eremochloae]|nr:hypothetical protein LZ32DRAFT_599456 [Colletotrichum eremochloae]
MVDAKTHHRIMADHAFQVTSFPTVSAGRKRKQARESGDTELTSQETSKFPPLTDEQALLASPKLCGFSFTEKKFLHFFVDRTSPIQWNAVLLIGEADVFLERPSLNNMERNGLVSIFLRALEDYSGILFMTTNRGSRTWCVRPRASPCTRGGGWTSGSCSRSWTSN